MCVELIASDMAHCLGLWSPEALQCYRGERDGHKYLDILVFISNDYFERFFERTPGFSFHPSAKSFLYSLLPCDVVALKRSFISLY